MKRMALALATLGLLLAPPAAGAVTLVNPDGSTARPYQTWASKARSRMPVPDRQITVFGNADQCAAEDQGCAWGDSIALRWRCGSLRNLEARRNCRFVFWHELGHQFDFDMPQWKRDSFAQILGVPASDWDESDLPLREDFADMYARCALRNREPAVNGMMLDVSPRQFDAACRLIRR